MTVRFAAKKSIGRLVVAGVLIATGTLGAQAPGPAKAPEEITLNCGDEVLRVGNLTEGSAAAERLNSAPLREQFEAISGYYRVYVDCQGAVQKKWNAVFILRKERADSIIFNPPKRGPTSPGDDPVYQDLGKQLDQLSKQSSSLKKVSDGLVKVLDQLRTDIIRQELVARSGARCEAVFRDTIDKKVSDLTTRETDLIKECKGLDLYRAKN